MHCGVACWWEVVLLYSRNNGKGCYLPSCLERTGGCSHPVVVNCVFESCRPDFERMLLPLTSVGLLVGIKLQAWAKVLRCADWFLLASVCLHACWPSGSHHSSLEMVTSIVLGLRMMPGCVSFIPSLSPFSYCSQAFPFPFWHFWNDFWAPYPKQPLQRAITRVL